MFGHFYLQNAFQNMTDPKYYQNYIRPRGNCKGNRQYGEANGESFALKPLAVNMSLELYNYATVNEITSVTNNFRRKLFKTWILNEFFYPPSRSTHSNSFLISSGATNDSY